MYAIRSYYECVRPKIPKIKADNVFTFMDFEDAQNIKDYIQKTSSKNVVILGITNKGLSLANNLIQKGFNVVLVDQGTGILKNFDCEFEYILREEFYKNQAMLYTNTGIKSVCKNDNKNINKITLENDTSYNFV